jgi:hypothetical protein
MVRLAASASSLVKPTLLVGPAELRPEVIAAALSGTTRPPTTVPNTS